VPAAPSAASSKAPSIARSVSEPAIPQALTASESGNNGGGAAKQIIGTLLGAAAGAAVAYAMVASERDSAKKEKDFNAFKTAKAAMASVAQFAQGSEQPKLSQQDPQPVYEAKQLPPHVHRNISDSDSQYSSPRARSVRAIEAAPSDHGPLYARAPTQISVSRQLEYAPMQFVASSRVTEYVPAASLAPSKAASRASEPMAIEYVPAASVVHSKAMSRAAELRAIEYVPAASVAPSRLSHRSKTSPEFAAVEKATSTVSKAQSAAPSSFISTFVPDEFERRNTDSGSVASHHSSRSKKSSHTKHSGSRSRAHSHSPSKAPSDAPSKAQSKVGSVLGSILGRGGDENKSIVSNPFRDEYEIDDYTDDDDYTIAPSDSISQVSSSHSRRKHRSHRYSKDEPSVTGSSASKHSRSSKHSSKSHRSRSSAHSSHYHTAEEEFRNSVVSEPSDASTLKPKKSRHPGRKDSATDYDEMFDRVQYGNGNVPVRGITPSMIDGGGQEERKSKSVMGYKMAQRLRAFEAK
jgi:hypothetical protein